ncbi:MAG: NlpC/P60 family protein [Terriglobales bacterium]
MFLLLLCGFAYDTLSAQQARTIPGSGNRHQGPAAARLLSLDEGLSVLGAALESRVHLGANSDCSHLVHAIYERAGFSYPYVSSSDLYAGSSEFRRVARPQPGDLVVWPGHVGIAISPVQHSFYSALHSGLGVEKYDDPYWRVRGRARFYRYVKAAPATVNAANARVARLSPATFGSAESRGDQEKTGVRTPLPAAPPEVHAVIPGVVVIDAARPSAGEITDALGQAFSDTAEVLGEQDVLRLPQPLIVFEELEVEQVHIERGQGWAEIRIRRPLPVVAGQLKHDKLAERQRWLLRHGDQNGWELVLPQGEIYLPRDATVRVLAHQLAEITDDPKASSGGHEKAQLARLLNVLLQ